MVQRVTPEEIAKLLDEARRRGLYISEDEGDADLDRLSRAYDRTLKAHEKAQRELLVGVFRAMLSGKRPTRIEAKVPFKGAYLRQLRTKAGLPGDQRYVRTPPRSPEP